MNQGKKRAARVTFIFFTQNVTVEEDLLTNQANSHWGYQVLKHLLQYLEIGKCRINFLSHKTVTKYFLSIDQKAATSKAAIESQSITDNTSNLRNPIKAHVMDVASGTDLVY